MSFLYLTYRHSYNEQLLYIQAKDITNAPIVSTLEYRINGGGGENNRGGGWKCG